jgi:hypothetical protein
MTTTEKPKRTRGPSRKITLELSETHAAAVVRLCEYDTKIMGVPVKPETMLLNLILYRCMKIAAQTPAPRSEDVVHGYGCSARRALMAGPCDCGAVLEKEAK